MLYSMMLGMIVLLSGILFCLIMILVEISRPKEAEIPKMPRKTMKMMKKTEDEELVKALETLEFINSYGVKYDE